MSDDGSYWFYIGVSAPYLLMNGPPVPGCGSSHGSRVVQQFLFLLYSNFSQ